MAVGEAAWANPHALKPSKLIEKCSVVDRGQTSTLLQCGKIKLLQLRGNPQERAKTMGSLLKGSLSPSVVTYFSEKIFQELSLTLRIPIEIIYNQLIRLMHRNVPPSLAQELDAMAAGMGKDSIFLRRAISLPDTAAYVNALGSLKFFRTLPAAGCTSVAMKDNFNRFIYGRNLDFAGVGLWDQNPLLILALPAEGSSELKHLVFGSDGALFGGITGVNEAGISFAVHQNYTTDAGFGGIPMMFVGELVLREAQSLEDAIRIIERNRPSNFWTFVLTDLKTGEALAIENSAKHFHIRKMTGKSFVQTNHIRGDSKAEFVSPGTKSNSEYRMRLAEGRMKSLKIEAASLHKAVEILSYQEDPLGKIMAHKDVLKAHTIQTILLEKDPAHFSPFVFVSQDSAPTASGSFLKFTLSELFEARDSVSFQRWDASEDNKRKRKSQEEISSSFAAYFDQKNIPKAISFLSGHDTISSALFEAVAKYQLGNYSEAARLSEVALHNPRFVKDSPHIVQSLWWVRLASLYRNADPQANQLSAQNSWKKSVINPRFQALLEALRQGRTPPKSSLLLSYEFFSGDIAGRGN